MGLPNVSNRRRRTGELPRPAWDAAAGVLWWLGGVAKRVLREAPNQRRVLSAFEELGWPERIDDPLPGSNGKDRKRRVRETAKSLNRGLAAGTIVFHADGSGRGFRWELVTGQSITPTSPPPKPSTVGGGSG